MASQLSINGFVLAGGRSSRMGQEKGLMRLGKKPLVLRAADIMKPFVRQVALLAPASRYEHLGLPTISDLPLDECPLTALCTGLTFTDADWNVFLACDLPLVSAGFMQLLVERIRATQAEAVVPRTRDGWQPLAAAYHARCKLPFRQALVKGQRSILGLFNRIRVDSITAHELAAAGVGAAELFNVNTPEEWARVKRLHRRARNPASSQRAERD